MTRLVWADRKTTVTQITTVYNWGGGDTRAERHFRMSSVNFPVTGSESNNTALNVVRQEIERQICRDDVMH